MTAKLPENLCRFVYGWERDDMIISDGAKLTIAMTFLMDDNREDIQDYIIVTECEVLE